MNLVEYAADTITTSIVLPTTRLLVLLNLRIVDLTVLY
jgi:hypothetical protein